MITVDGVFIAVGIVPVSALIAGTVETDEAGYIKAGEDGVTSVPGVFAAGDVRTKQLRQDHHGSRRRRELCDFGREISDQPLMASFE